MNNEQVTEDKQKQIEKYNKRKSNRNSKHLDVLRREAEWLLNRITYLEKQNSRGLAGVEIQIACIKAYTNVKKTWERIIPKISL